MTEPDEPLPPHLRDIIAAMPRQVAPRPGLEDEVVTHLRATGGLEASDATHGAHARSAAPEKHRSRVSWRRVGVPLAVALAAALLLFIRDRAPEPSAIAGNTYLFLLSEGPGFQQPTPAELPGRLALYTQWADSLRRAGRLERMAQLQSSDDIVGFFLIRAFDDAEAMRLARSSPHERFGGRMDVRRLRE